MVPCKICGGESRITHRGTVLGRHQATYRMCVECSYWFIDQPHWLEEAYSEAIAAIDTGVAQRNLRLSPLLTSVLVGMFGPDGVYVDYGGGYGLLVRLLRDAGLDFYWRDPHCQNLFARGFEWDGDRQGAATAVTAVEVMEHVTDPVAFVDTCLRETGADSFVFTQYLHDGTADPAWWYLAPEAGQHISFYAAPTLRTLAHRLGMAYHPAGTLHLLTKQKFRKGAFARAVKFHRCLYPLRRRRLPPRWMQDHEQLVRRIRCAA
ncbi:methyltransferase domain-containing protein [Streptomyces sp. PSKA54]|uniref:Methyltransferase domain-containing protein n=1 Tax=Streptomyces himalayensis subsp. aureolus TaxID=2758039 RepID=A0A7W2CXW1_9ACTN|nr:class I SAM-dependent methyltransferase [Streptomyces himalayensis]MBA4860951.1 methyltransferase domain-containing protein [Streptomyces himalayensis subsp. aureolus]